MKLEELFAFSIPLAILVIFSFGIQMTKESIENIENFLESENNGYYNVNVLNKSIARNIKKYLEYQYDKKEENKELISILDDIIDKDDDDDDHINKVENYANFRPDIITYLENVRETNKIGLGFSCVFVICSIFAIYGFFKSF